jgi:hypothetical protein
MIGDALDILLQFLDFHEGITRFGLVFDPQFDEFPIVGCSLTESMM